MIKTFLKKLELCPLIWRRLGLAERPARRNAAPGEAGFANIGEASYEQGQKSYLPDAGTSARYLLYKRGSDAEHCAVCGAGDDPLGPSDDQADAGIPIAIKLLGAVKGTLRVVTDGSVNNGDYVKCAANGQVTKANTGELSFGRANIGTDASSAAGDVISIIPVMPAKYSF